MNHPRQHRLYHAAFKSLAALAIIGCTATLTLAQAAPPPDGGGQQGPPPGGPDQGPPGGPGGPGGQMPPRGGPGMGGPGMGGPGMRGMGMPGGPDRRGMRPGAQPQQPAVDLTGTIEAFNYSPRGDIDGVMLKMSDKTAQINLPPGMGVALSQVSLGSTLKVSACPEPGQADHPIYELQSLTTEQGKKISAPGVGDDKFLHEEATIKQLNYARRGEVDGALLDNGDFVHVGPAAKDLKLSVGQKITVDGFAHAMLTSDHQAIHAVAIDGKAVRQGPPQGDGPDGGPSPRGRRGLGGPGGPGQGGPGGNDAPPPPGGRADGGQPAPDGPRGDAPQP
jgi:hypothetical protein